MDDHQLLCAWRRGDKRAGEALITRHYGRVVAFFKNKVSGDYSDLIQRTFLACVEGKDRFRQESKFSTYLLGIACRMLWKHYNQQQKERERYDFCEVSVMDIAPSPSRVIARQREKQVLLEALRSIPLDYQIVLELHYWEELTVSEIAEVMSIALGTAKTRVRRGKQLLEQQIERIAPSPSERDATFSGLETWARELGKLVSRSARGHPQMESP